MGACCSACAAGKPCEGDSCAVKPSAGADGPAHPGVARARSVTGSHPAYKPAAKPSAGIADIYNEVQAREFYPSDADLRTLGIARGTWDAMGAADRLRLVRAAAGGTPGGASSAETAEQDARRATLDGDDAAFQRALANVPEADRARLLEAHLRAQGASEEAIRAGLFRLGEQGLRGLTDWLNSDLQRDLEAIRGRSAVEQERIRQEAQTARAEIDAQTRRYEIDHPAYRPPSETPQGSSGSGVWMVAAAVVALLGVAALASRKAG